MLPSLKAADDDWRDFHGGAPDATSYETVVALLCQALRFEDARKLAKKALEKLGPSPGCAAMYVAIARAACVRCDHSAAAGAAKRARELLEHEGSKSEGGWSVAGSGGKRGTVKISPAEWKKEGDADDGARNRSNEVFQNHRRSELLAEIRDIESAVGAAASDSTGGGSSSSQTKRKRPSTAIDLGALWSRTLSFADHREQKTKQDIARVQFTSKFELYAQRSHILKSGFLGSFIMDRLCCEAWFKIVSHCRHMSCCHAANQSLTVSSNKVSLLKVVVNTKNSSITSNKQQKRKLIEDKSYWKQP
ncbi:unnamed protein product [Polarella glacialis]|uniref:Uncharacterized protein n=1 Tax=Polarella glacialis TaxID=89957 RepID=A0A813KKM2_POLGL|nr:unnamed protein product [Polarella glacialis]